MIRVALRLLARSLVDLGFVSLLASGLLLYTAWRILRRLATDNPSDLEEYARVLFAAVGTAAAAAARANRTRPPAPPRV